MKCEEKLTISEGDARVLEENRAEITMNVMYQQVINNSVFISSCTFCSTLIFLLLLLIKEEGRKKVTWDC